MKSRIQKGHWLITRACAHRGFHGNGIPENSRASYQTAIELGYPIEMDVQLTSDGVAVCFHDDTLERMTGEKAFVRDKTLEEIKSLRLAKTDEQIMTFAEFIEFVGGRVPLLIEIKTQKNQGIIEQKVIEVLDGYRGEFVIQSFDPRVMKRIRKLRPEIIRGQLMCEHRHKEQNFFVDLLLRYGFLNFLSKPDFINMNQEFIPLKRWYKRNKNVLCWTVRSESEEEKILEKVDGYVFEFITPKLK